MKRFILLFTIVLHAAFSSDFGAYAQSIQREDVIKKDSALFHDLAIDDTICPMINFQLAMRCYDYLKGYRYWERNRYVVSPGITFGRTQTSLNIYVHKILTLGLTLNMKKKI